MKLLQEKDNWQTFCYNMSFMCMCHRIVWSQFVVLAIISLLNAVILVLLWCVVAEKDTTPPTDVFFFFTNSSVVSYFPLKSWAFEILLHLKSPLTFFWVARECGRSLVFRKYWNMFALAGYSCDGYGYYPELHNTNQMVKSSWLCNMLCFVL